MSAHLPPRASQPGDALVAADLPCEVTSASRARRLVVEHCRGTGVGPEAVDALELLVSEVVTNAVLHGRSSVHLVLRVPPRDAPRASRVIRLEVGDDDSRHPTVQPTDAGALDGRGLAILDVVARAWGVRDAPVGKVVWLEVDDDAGP